MENEKEEKIGQALLKVALGYQIAEVTEEYAEVDGALKLTKRKKTKKDVPPDLKAVQMLLENGGNDTLSTLSDEELEQEKARLLAVLEETMQGQKPVKKPAKRKSVVKKSVAKTTVVKKKTTK